jgi:hypothetical protein
MRDGSDAPLNVDRLEDLSDGHVTSPEKPKPRVRGTEVRAPNMRREGS